jgi:hypothetical protein
VANRLLMIAQRFGLNDRVPDIHDFCNKEIVEWVDSLVIYHRYINLRPGIDHKLPYKVYNLAGKEIQERIIWISNDPSIASVNQSGLVTGISVGTTKILGSWCDIEKEVLVNVVDADCENEFCKHKICANGIFAGRGRLTVDYQEVVDQNKTYITSKYNVRFNIDLNQYSWKFTTESTSHYFSATLKYPWLEWSYFSDNYEYTDSGILNCYNSAFQQIVANPIFIQEIKYYGSHIAVVFGRRAYDNTYLSKTFCARVEN